MAIITLIVCLACTAFAYLDKHDIFDPRCLFCGFISIIVFLYSLRLYGIYAANFQTFIMIIVGVVCFFIGGTYAQGKIIVGFRSGTEFSKEDEAIRTKVFTIIVGFLLLFTLYRLVTVFLPMIQAGYSLDMIRMRYFGTEVGGYSKSYGEGIIETYVNLPFLYAIIPIFSIEIIQSKDDRKLGVFPITIALIWIVLSCVMTGGRVAIYSLVVTILCAFFVNRKDAIINIAIFNTKNNKRRKWLIIALIGVMVYVVYNLSINRNPDEEYDFFSSIYFYFCGCIPHTSIRLETIDFEYTFGFTFLSGMLRPFMLVYKYLFGGGSFPHLYQVSIDIPSTLQSPTVYIADGHAFNAFVLPFYYFYNDGGFIAVALESLLYGFFCTYTYERYKRTGKEKDFAKYLIVVNYIATSMIRYDFAIVYFALCYFYVNVFYSYEDCEDSKVPDS